MSFFSVKFLLFFSVVLLLLHKTRSLRVQQVILLLASCAFYALWDVRLLALLMTVAAVVWQAAKFVRESKAALYLGVGLPLLNLGVCKYLNFFRENFSALLGISADGSLSIILPLGISFYTFLALSYLLDVYHQKIDAERDFVTVALYVSFFPTVVSGPITKARDLLGQFRVMKRITAANLQAGGQIFLWGCLKKFVLADHLAVFVDDVYNAPLAFDSATVWLAVIAYAMQLYLDFAGYSDMAIGLARCMGFTLSENFNLPYMAKNISEFWKRWHISLSAWLQEYLYFALGGSRCGAIKIYRNLFLTMLICGLWHGAAWNFILWGGLHGLLLCGHRLYKNTLGGMIELPQPLKIGLTALAATLCWVFFRSPDLTCAGEIFYRLFAWEDFGVNQMYVYAWLTIFILLMVSLYAAKFNNTQGLVPLMDITRPTRFFLFCLEIFLLFGWMYTGHNPFVYANF